MKRHIHFIGIGGIGMSGIAKILHAQGCKISGSDIKDSSVLQQLRQIGVDTYLGHAPVNIKGADLVVYSSAIKDDNPEIKQALKSNIPLIKRAGILAELMQNRKVVAVAGAHGKTTTTSLISYLLIEAGLSPSVAIGGILRNLDSNAYLGDSDFFVAEADESDGTFLYYRPDYSVITNIDREHLDYYETFDNLLDAFKKFICNTKESGCLWCYGDDAQLRSLLKECKRKTVFFGLSKDLDIYPADIELDGLASRFKCFYNGKLLDKFFLSLGGMHNILNALPAIGIAVHLGIDSKDINKALSTFEGARRRLETKFFSDKLMVVDDYAHHPTEIKATLATLRGLGRKRIIAIFQPHRFSRTKLLIDDFSKSFNQVDLLILTDIYPAGEKNNCNISAQELYNRINGLERPEVCYLAKEKIIEHLLPLIAEGDLVVTLGAGDIYKISDELAENFKRQSNT